MQTKKEEIDQPEFSSEETRHADPEALQIMLDDIIRFNADRPCSVHKRPESSCAFCLWSVLTASRASLEERTRQLEATRVADDAYAERLVARAEAAEATLSEVCESLKCEPDEVLETLQREVWAAEATLKAAQWQPIETAPKDGTRILVFVNGAPGYWRIVARQLDQFDGWYSDPGKFHVRPTHWMPLPAPPAAALTASPAAKEPQ